MKKIISLLLTTILFIFATIPVIANDNITVKIDGQQIAFDVQPQLINNRTMVPLRAIFEALGATVDWNGDTQTVTSTKGSTTISLTINSPTMLVNGTAVTLDSPACLISGRTLVPVRAISEAFGTTVDWDGNTKTVLIYNPIIFSGTGDKVISNVNIPSGSYYAELTHNGSRNFISKLYYGEKSYDYFLLSNEIGNCSIHTALNDNGNVAVNGGMLEVKADGNWVIKIKPVAGATTTNINGSGRVVTGIFTAKSSRVAVDLSHSGKSNFIAKVIKYNGTKSYDYELLANEIGKYSGQKVVNLTPGAKYYFYVVADGEWSINFGEGENVTTYNVKNVTQNHDVIQNSESENDGEKLLNVSMDKSSTVAKNVAKLKKAIINNGQKTLNGYGFKEDFSGTTISLLYLNEESVCTFMMSSKSSSGSETATTLFLYEDQIPAVSISLGGELIFVANFSQPSGTFNIVKSFIDDDVCIEAVDMAFEAFDMFIDLIQILHSDFSSFDLSDFGVGM